MVALGYPVDRAFAVLADALTPIAVVAWLASITSIVLALVARSRPRSRRRWRAALQRAGSRPVPSLG